MSVFNVVRGQSSRVRTATLVAAALLFACVLLGRSSMASAASSQTVTPGGTVPGTLGLIVTSPAAFPSFVPGVAATYTTTMTATVVSTAGATALTAVDAGPSATPGHLVNSTFSPTLFDLPSALQASSTATNANSSSTGAQSLSGTPVALLNYSAPVTGDSETITFSQAIGATDALRTGAYGASITLTLTATTP
jgi:hypothetical protein